jgi:iron complex outermembrane receptor protein
MARRFHCGASPLAMTLAACLLSTTGYAAEAPPSPPPTPPPPPVAAVAEVVVTAEKREASLETTPVAISAFTAETRDLLGIQSVQDLTDYTPGLSYSTFDNRPYIRGVGRQSDNLAVESGVAVYVDGIYNGANASTILQLDTLFIDRIDVLRGPQSTLYGRNADGGAINYASRHPTSDFYAEARSGVDNYGKWFVEGATSGAINDHLKIRIAGNYTQERDGYYTNLDGSHEGGGVAQGGNGESYHAEIQFQGDLGPKFDWWAKVATSDYDVSYHTESQLGPLDTREFYDPLFPNQNYGLCLLPESGANTGCNAAAANPDKLVPGSLMTLANTPATNPASLDPRTFDADFRSQARERNNLILAVTGTWHGPGFDVKYLGGFQSFKYDLNAPWLYSQGISSGVESYALQGPATANPLCAALFASNLAGCTGNLTVNPAHTQFTFVENESFFSHELDFTSTTNGRLQWLAGLYYYHENYNQPVNVLDPSQAQVQDPINLITNFGTPAAANPSGSVYNEDTRLVENSYAAFAQFDYKLTDTLKLTGGVRYTADDKSGEEYFRLILFDFEGAGLGVNTFGANTPAFDATSCPAPDPNTANGLYPGSGPCQPNPAGGVERHLDAHFQALTGTINLAWTPTPDTLAYARYSRGYKAGGYNSGIVTVYPLTAPETIDAWEIGYKQTINRVLQANIDGFYYSYYNDQQPLGFTEAGVLDTLIVNLPRVRSYGVELEGVWRTPVKNLTASLNYAYLSSTITQTFCVQDAADPNAIAPGANTAGCTSVGPGYQNLKGETVPESPRNKVNLSAIYRIPLEPGTLTFAADYTWKDKTYDSPLNRYYNLAPSYTQVNLRTTFTDAKNRFTLIAYCNNLFNTLGYDTVNGTPVTTSPPQGQIVDRLYSFTAPRTFGLEVQVRFR